MNPATLRKIAPHRTEGHAFDYPETRQLPVIHGFRGCLFTVPVEDLFKAPLQKRRKPLNSLEFNGFHWLREEDLNL